MLNNGKCAFRKHRLTDCRWFRKIQLSKGRRGKRFVTYRKITFEDFGEGFDLLTISIFGQIIGQFIFVYSFYALIITNYYFLVEFNYKLLFFSGIQLQIIIF